MIHITALYSSCVFYKVELCSDPASSKAIGIIFPNSICSLCVSLSCFGHSRHISGLSIIFVMVIWDLGYVMVLLSLFWGATHRAHVRWKTSSVRCVFCLLHQPPHPVGLPLLGPPFSLRLNSTEPGPIINPPNGLSVCVKGRAVCLSL